MQLFFTVPCLPFIMYLSSIHSFHFECTVHDTNVHFQSKTLVFYDQDGEGSLGLYHSEHSDTVKKSDSGLPNFRLIYSAISGITVGVVNSEFNEKESMNNGASVVWTDLTEDFGDVVGEAGKELGDLRVCLITEGGNSGPAVRFLSGI